MIVTNIFYKKNIIKVNGIFLIEYVLLFKKKY